MSKALACAMTHVRNEHAFLDKWIAHYSPIVGRENLYVILDGSDWTPTSDLSGINVERVDDAPRNRRENDIWAAKTMNARANQMCQKYDYVIRGDVDEYVIVDPNSGLSWRDALREADEHGYITALGVDMIQRNQETAILDRNAPFLSQRHFGFVSDKYTKPFVLCQEGFWGGGAHFVYNAPVRVSAHFILIHTALCDRDMLQEREAARSTSEQHRSFGRHKKIRNAAFDTAEAAKIFEFDSIRDRAVDAFCTEPDGSPAMRPRVADFEGATPKGLLVNIPERFGNLV